MTIASAFNDIAVAQGGTADTSGTIAGAVDALNDALAGSNQPKAETIEGAIALLGQHVGGGGGGSFGPLQMVATDTIEPELGQEANPMSSILSIGSGEAVIASTYFYTTVDMLIAAGATAVFYGNAEDTVCDAYICVIDENYLYSSVTPWNGTVTIGSIELSGTTYSTYTLTVPELDFDSETQTGEFLVLYTHS